MQYTVAWFCSLRMLSWDALNESYLIAIETFYENRNTFYPLELRGQPIAPEGPTINSKFSIPF